MLSPAGAAASLPALLACRFAMGVGEAVTMPSIQASACSPLSDRSKNRHADRAKYVTYYTAAVAVAVAAAAAVAARAYLMWYPLSPKRPNVLGFVL